eukprot:scaffold2048_cov204-Alexandrium_tamarense.AAC.3
MKLCRLLIDVLCNPLYIVLESASGCLVGITLLSLNEEKTSSALNISVGCDPKVDVSLDGLRLVYAADGTSSLPACTTTRSMQRVVK